MGPNLTFLAHFTAKIQIFSHKQKKIRFLIISFSNNRAFNTEAFLSKHLDKAILFEINLCIWETLNITEYISPSREFSFLNGFLKLRNGVCVLCDCVVYSCSYSTPRNLCLSSASYLLTDSPFPHLSLTLPASWEPDLPGWARPRRPGQPGRLLSGPGPSGPREIREPSESWEETFESW